MATRKVLTIKIGRNTTQICEVDYRKKKPKIHRTLTVTTPEGLFLDGYITNAEDLGSYLSRKLKNAGLKTDHVVFSVFSNKIMSRDVEIPNVKNEMITPLIQAQAHEYLPIDITDYVISHTVLKKEKKAQSMNIMIFAAPKELLESYYELANNMAVKVESIDVEGNGSYQLLKTEVKGNATLVLQIAEDSTLATVIDNGLLLLQRNINMGLSSDTTPVNSKADEEVVVSVMEEPYGNQGENESVSDELEMLYGSVARIIDFYNNSKKGNQIEKVYLIGNGVNIANIEAIASKALELPVEHLKIFERTEDEEYLACIGAAINPADLIPYELVDFEQKKTNIRSYIALMGALVAACLFVVLISQLLYWGAVKEKARLESQIADKQYVHSEYDEYIHSENDYKYLSLIDSMTFRNNDYLCNVLNQIEDKLPANARIQSILSEGNMLTINCKTGSKPSFKETAEMLLQLKQISYFESVYIDGVVENTEDRTASFSVICTYAYEPNIAELEAGEEVQGESEGGAAGE